MKSKEGRRLVGRLESGVDVYLGLKELCKKYELKTGFLSGIGYLKNARLAAYDPETATFIEDEESTPPVQVLSLLGNLSQRNGDSSLHLQATLLVLGENGGEIRGGRLLSGLVADMEFIIDSVDDFTLVRSYDEETGLYPWLNIMSASHNASDEPTLDRTEFMPGRISTRSSSDEATYELHVDDTLEHPRLGTCTVISVPDEDRATIRLESGRTVELHLGLLKLERTAGKAKGHQTFKVIVRKRT